MPLPDLPHTPGAHFKLYFYAAVLYATQRVAAALGSLEAALEEFPFLGMYRSEIERFSGPVTPHEWIDELRRWESTANAHLPLRAIEAAAGLDQMHLVLLIAVGLCEEDPQFGFLFERFQGSPGQHRPTLGTLNGWFSTEVYRRVGELARLGIVHINNAGAPRSEWVVQPDPLVWAVLQGESIQGAISSEDLTPLADVILPESLAQSVRRLPDLLTGGSARGVIVRGPRHTGRHALVGAVARELGRGLLRRTSDQWSSGGPLATALHAMPVLTLDLGPSESCEIADLVGYEGPSAVVLGRHGGVSGPGIEGCVTLERELPGVEERRRHWEVAIGGADSAALDLLAERLRLGGGAIRRLAPIANAYASLEGTTPGLAHVQHAARGLDHEALDVLASHVPGTADWSMLVAAADVFEELRRLESRCRSRELLSDCVGPALRGQLNRGVLALFTGPSGTGKTLAARVLATSLGKDLYRLDLSAVVNKYIGETEKNLHRVFERAEDLDVVLLLDEGDALLTQRTAVQTSNDRYANLETNYLLQRLESFEGILIVTSNASQRIDTAFQRRMDVVVDFRFPEPSERWAIWQMHLPSSHAVDYQFLEDVALRCALNGGQIRNAAIFATLLAVESGRARVDATHVEAAVRREYRKSGAACPLRAAHRNGVAV